MVKRRPRGHAGSATSATSYKTYKTQGDYSNEIGLPYGSSYAWRYRETCLEMGADHFHDIHLLSELAEQDGYCNSGWKKPIWNFSRRRAEYCPRQYADYDYLLMVSLIVPADKIVGRISPADCRTGLLWSRYDTRRMLRKSARIAWAFECNFRTKNWLACRPVSTQLTLFIAAHAALQIEDPILLLSAFT